MAEAQENIEAIAPPTATAPDAPSKRPAEVSPEELHASQTVLPEESAILKTEKTTKSGTEYGNQPSGETHAPKRVRIEEPKDESKDELMKEDAPKVDSRDKVRGIAMVKAE